MNNITSVAEKCCGCRSCELSCPVSAIAFREDEEGFLTPTVGDGCIDCGKCLKVCPVAAPPATTLAQEGYAAYMTDRETLRKSSSGGLFMAAAKTILAQGGTVFGCAEEKVGQPHHIAVSSLDELSLLQGSKYVQSEMTGVYTRVQEALEGAGPVLFAGTPCQVAGLLKLVGPRENLFTVDIICHGVPSRKMYRQYLAWLEKKSGAEVTSFAFRSKEKHDWSLTYRVELQKGKRRVAREKMASLSPYYHHFLMGMSYRESCYVCPFARKERVSDLTCGDFWGIEAVAPDFYNADGVSCVLVNTEKGRQLWTQMEPQLQIRQVPVEQIVQHNGQLKAPTKRRAARDTIYQRLNSDGYDAVAREYRDRREELVDSVKDAIPNRTRQRIKALLRGRR